MSATSQVVIARALGLLSTALDAPTAAAAVQAVRTAAVDLEAEQARRVASYLAVQLVWRRMPKRSRAAMREWIEQEWARVMQSPVVVSARALEQGGEHDGL